MVCRLFVQCADSASDPGQQEARLLSQPGFLLVRDYLLAIAACAAASRATGTRNGEQLT
jgi:hypothetical protein